MKTRFRLTCADGQSYSETTDTDLFDLVARAHKLAAFRFSVRIQDWATGEVLFCVGVSPLTRYRG